MPALYSDLGYEELRKLRAGQLKFAYDASMGGDRLQSYPLRTPQQWVILDEQQTWGLGQERLSFDPASLAIGFVAGFFVFSVLGRDIMKAVGFKAEKKIRERL